MNHRDLDRWITGNGGEDQYPFNQKCDELGCVVAVNTETGEHFCLRCNQPVEIERVGGIDVSTPVEHVMKNTTHPIEEEPKSTKKMIDDLASNMGKMGDRDNMYLVEREYLEKLHDEWGKVIALEYAVKVLAERLYYFAVLVADSHSAGPALVEDPIDFIDDVLHDDDDRVHDSEIASDAVKKAAAEYEAKHGRKP